MFERLRQILVDSYVGAIGLGLLFAQAVERFANVSFMRTSNWLYAGPYPRHLPPTGFREQSILPELVRGLFLLLVFSLLLYWLYFPPHEPQLEQTALPFESEPEQTE